MADKMFVLHKAFTGMDEFVRKGDDDNATWSFPEQFVKDTRSYFWVYRISVTYGDEKTTSLIKKEFTWTSPFELEPDRFARFSLSEYNGRIRISVALETDATAEKPITIVIAGYRIPRE